MPSTHRFRPVEPGTPTGVSRRRFLNTVAAGSAGALAAGRIAHAEAVAGGGIEAIRAAQAG